MEDGAAPHPLQGGNSDPKLQEQTERHFKLTQCKTASKMSSGKNSPHTD